MTVPVAADNAKAAAGVAAARAGPAAAATAAACAKSAPLSSAIEAAVPGSFCADLWSSVAGPGGIFSAILAHPFLTELAEGSLDESCFKFYIVQGALYLREYARALALVASKAPRPAWTTFFCRCANEAYLEEATFHAEFLAYFDTTVDRETAATTLAPNSLLYTSSVLATVQGRAFYEGLAAVLPCFVVYLEVGKALLELGSPHPLYRKFIDRFSGGEYEALVMEVVHMANEVAAELGEAQRERMRAIFQQGCRLEWMFWDGSYSCQQWPV